MLSQASVDDLNSRVTEPVTVINFRPNIVVTGGTAYQEDSWNEILIGGQYIRISGLCNRCKMICVDQETAKEGKEPLLSLAMYRRNKGRIFFGVHSDHVISKSKSPSKLVVGSRVEVLSTVKREL